MHRVEARLHYQAAPSGQPYLNRLASRHRRRLPSSWYFHRNELRSFPFANLLLPLVKLPIAKAPITAENRYTLAACNLL